MKITAIIINIFFEENILSFLSFFISIILFSSIFSPSLPNASFIFLKSFFVFSISLIIDNYISFGLGLFTILSNGNFENVRSLIFSKSFKIGSERVQIFSFGLNSLATPSVTTIVF